MDPLLVAALVVVRFTLPAMNADTTGCGPGLMPLDDLRLVRLIGWTPAHAAPETLDAKNVDGLEGRPDSLSFDDRDLAWAAYVETEDQSQNVSCRSALRSYGRPWPVAVDPPPPRPRPDWAAVKRLYDVAGRRVSELRRPGVYFERIVTRDSVRTRRMVIR